MAGKPHTEQNATHWQKKRTWYGGPAEPNEPKSKWAKPDSATTVKPLKALAPKNDGKSSQGGVYVLKLKSDKYYVGFSKCLNKRIQQHFDGKGAGWTRKYPPILVEQRLPGKDMVVESQLTLEYMKRHGWKNVRGGRYVQIHLPRPPSEFEDEMSCFECQETGHLVADCPLKGKPKSVICSRCGRTNHARESCFATSDIDGYEIDEAASGDSSDDDDEADCARCGRDGHTREECFARVDIDGTSITGRGGGAIKKVESKKGRQNSDQCYRCGRDGHWEQDCYAKRDIDGDFI